MSPQGWWGPGSMGVRGATLGHVGGQTLINRWNESLDTEPGHWDPRAALPNVVGTPFPAHPQPDFLGGSSPRHRTGLPGADGCGVLWGVSAGPQGHW